MQVSKKANKQASKLLDFPAYKMHNYFRYEIKIYYYF